MNEKPAEGERTVCRVKRVAACYDGVPSLHVHGPEGMADDSTHDGQSVICAPCCIEIGRPTVARGGDPATLAGGRGRPDIGH
jgi:hypothetical protein